MLNGEKMLVGGDKWVRLLNDNLMAENRKTEKEKAKYRKETA